MRRLAFIFLLAVTAGALPTAWHWREGRMAAMVRLEHARAVRPSPPVVKVASVPPAPAPASAPAPTAKKPAGPASMTEAQRQEYITAMQPEAIMARRAKNPRLSELHAKTLRLEFLLKAGAFFRARKLGEADRERLLAAWTAYELEELDVQTLWREMGMPRADPALRAEQAAMYRRRLEAETSVLDAEGMAALESYRDGQGIRNSVMTFQGEATMAGLPLTLEQTDAVAAVLINSASSGRPARYMSEVDPVIAERLLAGVLSPEQTDLLLAALRSQAASRRLSQAVHAIRDRSAAGATAR